MNNLLTNVQNTDIIFTTIQDHTENNIYNGLLTSRPNNSKEGSQVQPNP